MIYYIYKITFLCGNHVGCYYIGKHCCKNEQDFKKYAGSGLFCQRYYKKHGKIEGITYTKEILCYCSSKEELAEKEREIIGNLYETDPLCMNMMQGGKGGALSEESCKKVSESQKGKHYSEETCKKISESGKGKHKGEKNGMYGKHHSEESCKKMSESRSGKYAGEKSYMYGKHPSEETRKKQSESHLGKHPSEETRKKQSESHLGKTKSKETRKKMSENHARYWLGKSGVNTGRHRVYNPDGTYYYE